MILTRLAYMHYVYHQLSLESTIDLQVQTHELVRIVDMHTPYRSTTHTRTYCTRPSPHTGTDIEENINFFAGGLVQGCIQDTQKRRIKQTHLNSLETSPSLPSLTLLHNVPSQLYNSVKRVEDRGRIHAN